MRELGTFNGVAPFVAPLSERLALAVERAEFAARGLLPFNLLFCVRIDRRRRHDDWVQNRRDLGCSTLEGSCPSTRRDSRD